MVRLQNIFIFTFLFILAACGGGGTSGGSSNNVPVSVIVTNDLTQNYSAVWVTVYNITAESKAGDVALYDNTAGDVINLADLSNVGSLLSVASVPAGTYTAFDVKLGTQVNLVANDGTKTATTFASNGGSDMVHFKVGGQLVVDNTGTATTFVLNFGLSNLSLNANGQVTLNFPDIKDIAKNLKQTLAKMTGDITAMTDTGFTLHTADGTDINVVLNANALKMYDDGATLDQLAVGMTVKVVGSYDPTTMTIEAISVTLKTSDAAASGTVEVKGTIIGNDPAMMMFKITPKDADFMPSTDAIIVNYDASTVFASGSADLLALDQTVEVKGTLDPTTNTMTATVIEIEGADCKGGMYHDYVDVKGTVISLVDNTLSLTVSSVSGLSGVSKGAPYDVDITDAFIKGGTLADIVKDVKVDIKGSLDSNNQFHAAVVEIDPETGGTHTGGMMNDTALSGDVTAINTTSMTVTVNMSMNLPTVKKSDSVVITLTANTTYAHDTMPVMGDTVEVQIASDTSNGLVATEVTVVPMPAPTTGTTAPTTTTTTTTGTL